MRKLTMIVASVVVAALAIRRIRERIRGKMNTQIGSWRRCSGCGEYSHTNATQCDNVQHAQPVALCNISVLQMARVMTVLTAPMTKMNIDKLEEYYAFGSFFLWLEEYTGHKWDSSSALIVFLMSEEHQMQFYDMLREYSAIVPNYRASGIVSIWLAMHPSTAKVVER